MKKKVISVSNNLSFFGELVFYLGILGAIAIFLAYGSFLGFWMSIMYSLLIIAYSYVTSLLLKGAALLLLGVWGITEDMTLPDRGPDPEEYEAGYDFKREYGYTE